MLNINIHFYCEKLNKNGLERTQTKTQGHHSIAPGIDRYDRISSTAVGLVDFHDIGCTFNVNIDRNGFDNNTALGMFVFVFIFLFF